MKALCHRCINSNTCREPLPKDECDDYKERITNKYIIDLFYGMSRTMQHSIIEIMKVTQTDGNNKTDKRGNG